MFCADKSMSVKERLNRLTGESPRPDEHASNREVINELRRKIDAIMERRDRLENRPPSLYRGHCACLEEIITGEEVENSCGRFYFCRNRFSGTASHGHRRISTFADIDMEAAGFMAGCADIADMGITDALFLDTETTGLAGGTGTFAFLIGLGWFEGEDFIVCQLFARDFSEEQSMLFFLQEIAQGKRFLVTFNGRAYDMNLLSTRYILKRLEDPFTHMPHLDLLHPSRRLVGHRLENSRLATLETHVLGFERRGDVPGYEIPGRYFDWLRRRDAGPLEDVFVHNRLDIVSMAALAWHLADLLKGPDGELSGDSSDILAAARMHYERGDIRTARQFYECVAKTGSSRCVRDARQELSLMHKRAGCWGEAVRLWEDMLSEDAGDVFAAEELAKWLEHREYDHARALGIVDTLLTESRALPEDITAALKHRAARLRAKLAKAGPA